MSINGLPDVKVGDSLILATNNRYRGDQNVTVSRVGRQYLYVAVNGRELRERFHRATGAEDTKYMGGHLYTQEQYEEQTLRASLFEKLRQTGLTFEHGVRSTLSTDKLRALLAVMAEDAADRATEK
ncbi:hypothetical protein [Streptomyces sp. AD55]|uniref:beta barrel domain-containing protein n=1 Tax=Streptomyces sp. AD55 TaxID=3242895 RepID=UPI0035275045